MDKPQPMDTGEYGIFYGETLYKYDVKKDPVVENILYRGDAICISSRPGMGKSLLLKHFMCNLTTGSPFLDMFEIPKPCNVLYVQTEGDRGETIERIGNMRAGLKIDDKKWVHINLSGVILNTDKGANELMELASRPAMKYDVIMIDPLYTTIKGNLSDSEVATDWIRNVRRMKDKFKSSLIVSHHETKDIYHEGSVVDKNADDLFGSAFWSAFFNHNFKLKKIKGVHYLQGGKQRSGKIIDKVAMTLVEPRPLMYISLDSDVDLSILRIQRVLEEKGRMTAKKLSERTELSLATVYRGLNTLIKNGSVGKTDDNGIPYYEWRKK